MVYIEEGDVSGETTLNYEGKVSVRRSRTTLA